MKKLLKILKYLTFSVLLLITLFVIGGLIIKNEGQQDVDVTRLIKDHAKIARDKNGRKIEYFTYGSTSRKRPAIINIHGSGLDGTFEKSVHQDACKALNLRGISISLPGCGNTDMKMGRKVIEWASEDLKAVLDQEKIGQFMITGHSQGNPHAMAAAFHYKRRCVGLGLNAPLLPNDVTSEVGIAGAIGYEDLKTTEELQKLQHSWWFFMWYLTSDLLSPELPVALLHNSGTHVKEDTELTSMMEYSFNRTTTRGAVGQAWECIWHASDDTFCPPAIGVWLADFFKKKGARVNFKHDDMGMNHMTYCSAYFRKPENSMEKLLLDGIKKK